MSSNLYMPRKRMSPPKTSFSGGCNLELERNLPTSEVFEIFPLPYKVSLLFMPKYFRRPEATIIIACHGETVCARVIEGQDVAFLYFSNPSVAREGVGFADVTHYRIETLLSIRIRNVVDLVSRSVEHRPDQVIEPAVNPGKDR